MKLSYTIFNLGDSALTIDFGNRICEELNDKVIAIERWLAQHPFEGLKERVVSYSSLTIYYDPFVVKKHYHTEGPVYRWVEEKIRKAAELSSYGDTSNAVLHKIPVCYDSEYGFDLDRVSALCKLSKEEIINLHSSVVYRVYMIGFLPGFPYLGKIDSRLSIARKERPSLVAAGSVGVAGEQTGIYPFESPGGWNIIGKTPLSLFDANADKPVWLAPGDKVQFYAISGEQLSNWPIGELTN